MLRNSKALALSAAFVGLVVVTSIVFAQTAGERQDCPGKITCPQTGEQVCRDKCPTVDSTRPDCPGRIVCPLTGELVCKDRCPLKKDSVASSQTEGKVPSCCATKG